MDLDPQPFAMVFGSVLERISVLLCLPFHPSNDLAH
jgi:hypothetical protein